MGRAGRRPAPPPGRDPRGGRPARVLPERTAEHAAPRRPGRTGRDRHGPAGPGGNRTAAASTLGLARSTLYRKIAQYRITA
ncbi:helix-turn-helix domain-containing protein [Pseudonocardia xishanensis]|uniref:helix-turn-helix domain-containing protein n=1 Tax=Pseudonocardia xishanensis TaxID=630995 RepID=UPI0031EEB0D2